LGAVLALLASTGWQIGACELARYELQDEGKDLASPNSSRIGLAPPSSDDDRHEAATGKARGHDGALDPSQVTVPRLGISGSQAVYVAVDYRARIALPGFVFTLHFNPASGRAKQRTLRVDV
jgi:hypothetical protein